MGCSNPSRPRASALTLTNSPQTPAKTTRPHPCYRSTAHAAARRLDPPPARCLSLRLSFLLRSLLSPLHSVICPTTALVHTRPRLFTTCFLCRALTPPDYLYGGWAGSGPGTGRKPP